MNDNDYLFATDKPPRGNYIGSIVKEETKIRAPVKHKDDVSEDVEEFLAKGGTIQRCEPQVTILNRPHNPASAVRLTDDSHY